MSKPKVKKSYIILAVIAGCILLLFFGISALTRNQESTDDAQIDADLVPLSARVGGSVKTVSVKDHQAVKEGDLILELDPRDYEIRVHQAEAELEAALAQAESDSKGGLTNNVAQVNAARAALTRAEAELNKTETDLMRDKKLFSEKAISPVEFENAKNAFDKARASRDQASAQLKMAEDQHGFARAKVKAAQAALDNARTQLSYTKVLAPRSGTLSKIAVQAGQLIQAGQPIAQLVSNEPFVIANFKETQIGRMRPGQSVKIAIDAYPGHEIQGKVQSLSNATGARFSLIPPDNATGNFVKVVQRVPVKIELIEHPENLILKAGLSVDVTVFLK